MGILLKVKTLRKLIHQSVMPQLLMMTFFKN